MPLPNEHWEPLSPTLQLLVSPQHRFNTDTILLAWFSAPRHKDLCMDFGTGCGTIPLLWAERFQPKHSYAVELQENACALVRRSLAKNKLESQITLLEQDLCLLANIREAPLFSNLDLIACNPPYKEQGTGIVNPDASRAIARHEGACTMADIAASAVNLLKYGGRFCLCQRPQRMAELMALLSRSGLEPKRLRLVQQRADKAPSLFLLECKKGGKPGLLVEPTLLIEDASGGFSSEMRQVYGSYQHKTERRL